MTRFMLQETVIFDDETLQIVPLAQPATTLKLSATASRCLLLFIQRQGEVIEKDVLIHECWGKYGVMVTEGSMWKTISQLRQMFQNVGVPFEVIVTVPRLGYTFSSELQVRELSVGELKSPPTPVERPVITEKVETSLIVTEQDDEPELREDEAKQPLPVTRALPDPQAKIAARASRKASRRYWIFAGMALLVVNSLVAFGVWHQLRENQVLGSVEPGKQYRQIETQGNAEIFLHNGMGETSPFAKVAQQLLAEQPSKTLSGKAPRYVYINRVNSLDLSSYFLCDLPLDQAKNQCRAYFIMPQQGKQP